MSYLTNIITFHTYPNCELFHRIDKDSSFDQVLATEESYLENGYIYDVSDESDIMFKKYVQIIDPFHLEVKSRDFEIKYQIGEFLDVEDRQFQLHKIPELSHLFSCVGSWFFSKYVLKVYTEGKDTYYILFDTRKGTVLNWISDHFTDIYNKLSIGDNDYRVYITTDNYILFHNHGNNPFVIHIKITN